MEFCNLKSQYQSYKSEVDTRIAGVLESAYFVGGPEVNLLEKNLTEYVGASALSCANGTDALELTLLALEIGPGDEVITTPFTFFATVEMIAKVGAKPVLVDVNECDFNINVQLLEQAITSKTKAIIPVSLFGLPCDMNEINQIADSHKLHVIEDGAQSFGAVYKGKKSCNLSTIATTSFFPAKPLGCYGDGGAVFSSDEELIERIKILKNHGQSERYLHAEIGINSRLDAIQAAVLNVKLKYHEEELRLRREIASKYSSGLDGVGLILPEVFEDKESAWAQYTIRTSSRNELQAKLSKEGIPTAVHYPVPIHLQKAFSYLKEGLGSFKVSEMLSNQVLSLPMSAFVSDEEILKVVSAIEK